MKMAGDGLHIEMAHLDGESVLVCHGEIDLDSAASFEAAIYEGLQHTGRVVLDFGGVRFMDSSGLNVLVAAAARPDAPGDSVLIRNAPAGVQRLLAITGLEAVIRLEHDQVEANQSTG